MRKYRKYVGKISGTNIVTDGVYNKIQTIVVDEYGREFVLQSQTVLEMMKHFDFSLEKAVSRIHLTKPMLNNSGGKYSEDRHEIIKQLLIDYHEARHDSKDEGMGCPECPDMFVAYVAECDRIRARLAFTEKVQKEREDRDLERKRKRLANRKYKSKMIKGKR